MSERLVVVTGAAGGIGAAVCQRLMRDGMRVVALDIDKSGLDQLKSELGTPLETLKVDQTKEEEVRNAISDIEMRIGSIDALVNVLGWSGTTHFDQETSDYWSKVININYMALLFIAQPVLKAMIGRSSGKMVFVASDAGRAGASGQAVYAGAKGAVIAFAKSLARENARHNITVNCVAPGPTETPLFVRERDASPELVARIVNAIPLKRPALPAEQAAAVSFLLSADADYITGQTLSVSGGLSMV